MADEKSGTKSKAQLALAGANQVRLRVAQVIWLVCVVAALLLAVGALLIALDANAKNELVKFVLGWADKVDLGIFDRKDGIKDFTGKGSQTKDALFNWGLGAIAWLIAGRIGSGIIRP